LLYNNRIVSQNLRQVARYSDKDEIYELRRENEQLRRQIAILPNKKMDDLLPMEKATLDYIEKNPGTNKEGVVYYLKEYRI
jgi:hypothetical protein